MGVFLAKMEVLDNGNHIKGAENQTSGGDYTCRLPRDLNIGTSSVARSKGESDVRLLVACKAQLSSEVIRWKTESLRLQKERDAARIRVKELDQILGKFSEKTRELENRLSMAEVENKKLRGKAWGSSNISALHKLSMSLDKYHSYPWEDTQTNPSACSSSCMNTLEVKKEQVPQDDWKEVSQQLLEKMKQEMKELQELSSNFSLQENDSDQINVVEQRACDAKEFDDKLEEGLFNLISETESIKHCLLEQRKSLKTLMNNVIQGNIHLQEEDTSKDASKTFKTLLSSSVDQSAHFIKPKTSTSQLSRHSDDSFRAFFTKHLEGCQNIDKMSKTMQLFMQTESQNTSDANRSPSKITSPKLTKLADSDKRPEEERVCPICQAPFDDSIPQREFEEHVLDHLEVESASLLDQYVVL